jgi:glycosyltransferase involved in cell wall biosynthesis
VKIHFDNVAPQGTGPGTFAHRLAARLFEIGHEVSFSRDDSPVSLVFIERSGAPLADKVVQRLDGFWFKPGEFAHKNVGIEFLHNYAHAVVYQSQFDRKMAEKWFGSANGQQGLTRVVCNGIKIDPIKELTIPALINLRAQYDRLYVCSANWHPQKRLGANIRLFNQLRKTEPNSCLIILGNNPDHMVADPHIFYTGTVRPEVFNQIYSAADWMLHLAWADHCPNVVVEALVQGTPVVCGEVGGTKELVGQYGIVLEEAPYAYELTDYDSPPDIDVSQVKSLPSRLSLDYTGVAERLDINLVAEQYVSLFERLIRR